MTVMIEILHTLLLLSLRLTLAPDASPTRANTIASHPAEVTEVEKAAVPALRAQELYHDRHFEAALPVAEEAVERAWREHGGDDYQTIAAEEFLAHLAALAKDPERAQLIREETDRKLERLGNAAWAEKIRIVRTEEYRETAAPPEK